MKNRTYTKIMIAILLVGALLIAGCSQNNGKNNETQGQAAANYPEKPITMLVGVDAGGAGDVMARILIPYVEKHLPNNGKIIIENAPGAAQTIAGNKLHAAKPDGYTIAQLAAAPITIKPLMGETDYQLDDLQPVANLYDAAQLIMMPAGSPYQTFEEWLAYVKDNPEKFRMGISGVGNAQHIALEDFAKAAGVSFSYVIYKSDGETLTNLLGGHIDGGVLQHMTVKEYVDAGQLHPLVNITGVKPDYLTDLATLKEKGYDVEGVFFNGVVAPKGISADRLAILVDAFDKALKDPELIEEFNKKQAIINYLGPDDFGRMLAEVTEKNKQVLVDMGIIQ